MLHASLLQALREPSADCHLFLVGQPIIPVMFQSESVYPLPWYELLLRLHVDGVVHSPGAFFPDEEHTATLTEIDWWVINHAAAIMQRLPYQFSINFSKYLLEDLLLSRRLKVIFKDNPQSLASLIFEISERYRQWSDDEVYVMGILSTLCRLELDDVGEAPLNSLMQLPVSGFKIDGALMREIPSNPRACALVRSLISFAWGQNFSCVCEYVATQETLQWLRLTRIDFPGVKLYAQGHAVGGYKNMSECTLEFCPWI